MLRISAVVLLSACGVGLDDGDPSTTPRTDVARAALSVRPNDVSCSTPARHAFATGVCLCEDLHLVGSGVSIMSSDRPTVNVGVNGVTHVVGHHTISGSLLSFGGVDDVGTLTVGGDVVTAGNGSGVGNLSTGGDLSVGGDLSTVGDLRVGGVLRVKGNVSRVGSSARLTTGPYVAPAGPPCGCDAAQFLDVSAEVRKARVNNDNAGIGLGAVNSVGTLALDLQGGRYYLQGVSSVGSLKLKVHSPSALYIDGDLETVGRDSIEVDEGASLDLYISGSVENVGTWTVGKSTLAGVVRLYVGGTKPLIESVGTADFVGSIYAPTADVELVGTTRIRGALFARRLSGTGSLVLDYAACALPAEGSCPP